jgi:hypothetical protein
MYVRTICGCTDEYTSAIHTHHVEFNVYSHHPGKLTLAHLLLMTTGLSEHARMQQVIESTHHSPSNHLGLKASDHKDATSNNGCNAKGGQLEQPQHSFHLIVLALHLEPILHAAAA